jgi:hypothetical protein
MVFTRCNHNQCLGWPSISLTLSLKTSGVDRRFWWLCVKTATHSSQDTDRYK